MDGQSALRTLPVAAGTTTIGDGGFAVFAGPCAVESREQMTTVAKLLADLGVAGLRGGAYKPRTSRLSFQGHGRAGLEILAEVSRAVGLPVVTEAVDTESLAQVVEHADMIQIGARNAQNFSLLRACAATGRPVLLKRGFGMTIDEWLGAADYASDGTGRNVVLCERGIRSFEPATRFTLDLAAVPVVQQRSHYPIIVDPSHSTGRRSLVRPMALAAAAAGADGLLIDVHHDPSAALCDGDQAITPDEYAALRDDLTALLTALGRRPAAAMVTPG